MRDELAWTAALSASLLVSLFISPERASSLPSICVHYRLTGRPCPGCGLFRAFVLASHGRIGEAVRLNVRVAVAYPLAIYIAARGWKRTLLRAVSP